MKKTFLLSIISAGLLLGTVGQNIAQQIKKMPAPNASSPAVVTGASAMQKYVPNSPDESTPIAPISKKEIKNSVKKGKNASVLGGDKKISAVMPGVKVGYTYYDFQTNNSMPERLAYYDDGANKFIQMFWMASLDSSKGASGTAGQLDAVGFNNSRGAHYAFIDVSNPEEPANQYEWKKMAAEKTLGVPERRGWPSIVQFKNGAVGTPSHTPVDFYKNGDYGDETFTKTSVDKTTSTWPRAAIDGQEIIHVIYNTNTTSSTTNDPSLNFTCYRRSTDKGKTWEAEKIFTNTAFDGTFPKGGGGDSYAIAARDNNVVVFYGEYPNSRGIYRKSTDNGVTWSAPLLAMPTSYAGVDTVFYDADSIKITTDTVLAAGDQFDVILDSDGKAHFIFNLTQSYQVQYGRHQTIGGKDSIQIGSSLYGVLDALTDYYSQDLGFGYCIEGQAPIHVARPSFLNWDGNGTIVSRRYASGICRYPQLGIDSKDNIYMTFTSIKSGDMKKVGIDTTVPNRDGFADVEVDGLMGHIYVTHTLKGDGTNPNWSVPKDISPEGVDCLFGTLCNSVINDRMYIAYSSDATPGDRVTNTELPTEQTEIHMYPFSTALLNPIPPVGVEEDAAANNGFALTAQPNPTNGLTAFAFAAPQTGNAIVTISNTLGMNVATLYNGMLNAGTTHSVSFDAQNLSSGAYYATLEINGHKITKMITIVK